MRRDSRSCYHVRLQLLYMQGLSETSIMIEYTADSFTLIGIEDQGKKELSNDYCSLSRVGSTSRLTKPGPIVRASAFDMAQEAGLAAWQLQTA